MNKFITSLKDKREKWVTRSTRSSAGSVSHLPALRNPTLWQQGLMRRIFIAGVVGVVGVQFLPSLAENLSTPPINNQLITQETNTLFPLPIEDSFVVTQSTSTNDRETATGESSSTFPNQPSVTYLDSGTVAVKEPEIQSDHFILHIPTSVKVDPRARSVLLPNFYGGGDTQVEMCISSSSPQIQIVATGAVVPVYQEANTIYKTETGTVSTPTTPIQVPAITGNGTNQLILTGTLGNLLNTVNGERGLIIRSNVGELSENVIGVKVVPISEPSTNINICEMDSNQNNSYQILFVPIDLDFSQSLGVVKLHK